MGNKRFHRRYERNRDTFSPGEMEQFGKFSVFLAGCGGLGGYVAEMLGRLGIGHLTVVDGDVFDETNLNRQLLCTEEWVGKSKALAAEERLRSINSEIGVRSVTHFLDQRNCRQLIQGHDLVIDALDSVSARFLLAEECAAEKIPMVHGAIAGWYGQVSVIFPGDRTLDVLYTDEESRRSERELGIPSFTPALIASMQVTEAVKVLLKKQGILRNKVLTVDLMLQDYEIFDL